MKNLIYVLFTSVFIISCVRDKKTSWDTEMLTPIVKSELTVSEILKSEYLKSSPDSTLKLVYSSDLFSMNTDSFVTLPAVSYTHLTLPTRDDV